jgi:hypothetical protein
MQSKQSQETAFTLLIRGFKIEHVSPADWTDFTFK